MAIPDLGGIRVIHLAVDGPLATVTLDRPPVNAFDEDQADALAKTITRLANEAKVGLVLVRSAGQVFCAGADLKLISEYLVGDAPGRSVTRFAGCMQGVLAEWEQLECPTLAVVRGPALGAGLELALACDLRVVAHSARLGFPEASLGALPAGGGTQRLARLIGPGRAKRLMMGAEVIDGQEAERLGIAEWSAPAEQLEPLVDRIVANLLDQSAAAQREIKRCIQLADTPHGYDAEIDALRRCYEGPEAAQRIEAFLGRRRTQA